MKLISACTDILDQLSGMVDSIETDDFRKPSPALSGSTVGQHLRHTLEFFLCLEAGYSTGVINYDKRGHDRAIETEKQIALETIMHIRSFLSRMDQHRLLQLELNYDFEKEDQIVLQTTASRELVYNIEHAVHHMALMKIGIREVAPYISLEKGFGVAASTIRYQEQRTVTSE